ncbi:MAG: transglutaminase domain-containing protein [Ignavibacteriales bacterium]
MKRIIYLSLAIIIFIASSVVIFIVLNKDTTITPPPIVEYKKPTVPYGWEYLNDWQKKLYEVIEGGTLQVGDTYNLNGERKLEDAKLVVDLYYQNNPVRDPRTYNVIENEKLVSHPNDSSLTYYVGLGTTNKINVSQWGHSNFDEELRKISEIDKKTNEILSLIPNNSTDFEKIKIIYDYFITNIKYDYDSYYYLEEGTATNDFTESSTAYGALINGKAICEGIARAFYYVANKAGIYTLLVKSVSRNHAWNIVWLKGKYYRLDATWQAFLTYDDYEGNFVNGVSLPDTKHNYE